MSIRRICLVALAALLFLPGRALADGETPAPTPAPTPATLEFTIATPSPVPEPTPTPEPFLCRDPDEPVEVEVVNLAAAAARMLRDGVSAPEYRLWRTAAGHYLALDPVGQAALAALNLSAGRGAMPSVPAAITFTPCNEVPMLYDGQVLALGENFNLHGSVYSDEPLQSVAVTIRHKSSSKSPYPYKKVVTFRPEDNVTAYSLNSDATVEGASLNERVLFDLLKSGRHSLEITARTVSGATATLVSVDFTMKKLDAVYVTQNNFNDNYSLAYEFFGGDTSKFLFPFTWRVDRSISTNAKWREAHIVEGPLGRCHVDAVPYFEKANAYLNSTYLRVSGKKYDSKVIQLAKLVKTCGTYVPRFTNSCRYISHHTLGTCADVNAYLYPNKDILTNHELIGDEVRNNLVYNGIKTTSSGQQYYDFTYNGSYKASYQRVATPILNYLLYELAFYRAGFGWGFYYTHACDGMHFTLTDVSRDKHNDPAVSVRKVFEYIED